MNTQNWQYWYIRENKKISHKMLPLVRIELGTSAIPVKFEAYPNELTWHVLVRTCLHQESAPTLQPLCRDTSDPVLIENNGVTAECGYNSFWSDYIVFNQTSITSIIAALPPTLSVNELLEHPETVFCSCTT